MLQSATLTLLTVLGVITSAVNGQASLYNYHSAACVANGYGYCASDNTCFEDQSLPNPKPITDYDTFACQANTGFETNSPYKTNSNVTLPTPPTGCSTTSCGENCIQNTCDISCGDGCVEKTCKVKDNTNYYVNCANSTCQSPCTEKCSETPCPGKDCKRIECTTECGTPSGASSPCKLDTCQIKNCTGQYCDIFDCPPPCTKEQCFAESHEINCGDKCTQTITTTCDGPFKCTPTTTCVQKNGTVTGDCEPFCPINKCSTKCQDTPCEGANCTWTNCTFCTNYPDCQPTESCSQRNCTSRGCKTGVCVTNPPYCKAEQCQEGCRSTRCDGRNCTQTECSVCSDYPACQATTTCEQRNCTSAGCRTQECTCSANQCTPKCLSQRCNGEDCTWQDCISCSSYPECRESTVCTVTNCTENGCKTSKCPEKTCENQLKCQPSCNKTKCSGSDCTQYDCTVCSSYPDCVSSETCYITNCTGSSCKTFPCPPPPPPPTCENTGRCFERCQSVPCYGWNCIQTNCSVCSDYPACQYSFECVTKNCTPDGRCNPKPCEAPTCANQGICIDYCNTTQCAGRNCTQSDCQSCTGYPDCQPSYTCTQRNCTNTGCKTQPCPAPTCDPKVCDAQCITSKCDGPSCIQNDCTECSDYPDCKPSYTCTQTNNTNGVFQDQACVCPKAKCKNECTSVACQGANCTWNECFGCDGYPSCGSTYNCTVTNCTENGCKTSGCPIKTCANQNLCTPTCTSVPCAGRDCTQTNCTTCADYPFCGISGETCTIRNCTGKRGCKTYACPPPPGPTCENTGKCIEQCSQTACDGADCTQSNCTKCADYPSCVETFVCSITNCTNNGGCKVYDCPPPPTCQNTGLCLEGCKTKACYGDNCVQSDCVSCSSYPNCAAIATCTVKNCTFGGECITGPCPAPTCQNQFLCDPKCVETPCAGRNCTQSDCNTCSSYPSCISTGNICTIRNCTSSGCKTSACPPPSCDPRICQESCSTTACDGPRCTQTDCVTCTAYPDCFKSSNCSQTNNTNGIFSDQECVCPKARCKDACTNLKCKGVNCQWQECSTCSDYPFCNPGANCTVTNCTTEGCQQFKCPEKTCDNLDLCSETCAVSSCEGENCTQYNCTTCAKYPDCSVDGYNCYVTNCTDGKCETQVCPPPPTCENTGACTAGCVESKCFGNNCVQTDCTTCSSYPACRIDVTCTVKNCTNGRCTTSPCPAPTCLNQFKCTDKCVNSTCDGPRCTQTDCTVCSTYPSCIGTETCSQRNYTNGQWVVQDCVCAAAKCTPSCNSNACKGDNCLWNDCTVCDSYPSCNASKVCTVTNCTLQGCDTFQCPPRDCDNQGLCTAHCHTEPCAGKDCLKTNCTSCKSFPGCESTNECTIRNCTTKKGCKTYACPPPPKPTCQSEGLCIEACTVDSCEGADCTTTNCTKCGNYPTCKQTYVCSVTNCTAQGCKVGPCPAPPTCENQDICTESCQKSKCFGEDCEQTDCKQCGAYPGCLATYNCTVKNATANGNYSTYNCPEPTCLNSFLCDPKCVETRCAGQNCTQSNCTTCGAYPRCEVGSVCSVRNCTRNGCRTQACPPPPCAKDVCEEKCVNTTCAGNNCQQSNCSVCSEYPECNTTYVCTQRNCSNGRCTTTACPPPPPPPCTEEQCKPGVCTNETCFGPDCVQSNCTVCSDAPECKTSIVCTQRNCTNGRCTTIPCPQPTCENQGACYESCVNTTCAGNNCRQSNCSVCSEYPTCNKTYVCTQRNCTNGRCTTIPCPPPPPPPCSTDVCEEKCVNTTCLGRNCVESNCSVCSDAPECETSFVCTQRNCTNQGCKTTPCPAKTCANQGICTESCTQSECDGPRCTQTDCTVCSNYPNCSKSSNCTQRNYTFGAWVDQDCVCAKSVCQDSCNTTRCAGDDCTWNECFTCAEYPSCARSYSCQITNCTSPGNCEVSNCPERTCENQGLCTPQCQSTVCAGRDCTQTNCTICANYPDCSVAGVTCTIRNCTGKKGCKTYECPPPPGPTCESEQLCTEGCAVSQCQGVDCTQSNCTKCTGYPSCVPTYVCSVTNCTANGGCKVGPCPEPPTCNNTGLCEDTCKTSKCFGENCVQSDCQVCSSYPSCQATKTCTVKNCTADGKCDTYACPAPTCLNTFLCDPKCDVTACAGRNCEQSNCTTCGEYPRCEPSNVCTIRNCTNQGCRVTECPPPPAPTCDSSVCQESCSQSSCDGARCTQTDCVTCTEYPECAAATNCSQRNYTSGQWVVQDCICPRSKCTNRCTNTPCKGSNCTWSECTQCSEFPQCVENEYCTVTNCTSAGCKTFACPPRTCENQLLCENKCDETPCEGIDCTQYNCSLCSDYPSCRITAYDCYTKNLTANGGYTFGSCPPPPTCENQNICEETCSYSSCFGKNCIQTDCVTCGEYPLCERGNKCSIKNCTETGRCEFSDCPEPTCANQGFCYESCDVTQCAGRNCQQSNCTTCGAYPTCAPSNVCTQRNCTQSGCKTTPCPPPSCANQGLGEDTCTESECDGPRCIQTDCVSYGDYPQCRPTANCTQRNFTDGQWVDQDCVCNKANCWPKCTTMPCAGNNCILSECTVCTSYPDCTPSYTCQITNITGLSIKTSDCPEKTCDNMGLCVPKCDVTSCAGANCTQSNCTTCSSYPSCQESDYKCSIKNCTSSGCKVGDCPPPPTCENQGRCFESCVSKPCFGDSCVETNCSICSEYPGCFQTFESSISNCTSDGRCTTGAVPEPTCLNQFLCDAKCTETACAGRNCTRSDCTVCSDYPQCFATSDCFIRNCTSAGCKTTPCPPPDCDARICEESCVTSKCDGPNCVQTDCTTCTDYPFCWKGTNCSQTNVTNGNRVVQDCVCAKAKCEPHCVCSSCLGGNCIIEECTTCSEYPSCNEGFTCTMTNCTENGCKISECPVKNCQNMDLCHPSCNVTKCAGSDCLQTECTTCSAYPFCETSEKTCSIRNCTARKGCKTYDCPPPPAPTCENTGRCIEKCVVEACTGADCTKSTCTKCGDYPDCKPQDVCTFTNCTNKLGCVVNDCSYVWVDPNPKPDPKPEPKPEPEPQPTCDDCETKCSRTKCQGNSENGCIQTLCQTTCSVDSCESSNCTIRYNSNGKSIATDCENYVYIPPKPTPVEPEPFVPCPADPPIPSTCPKTGRSFCGTSQCPVNWDGTGRCTKKNCITFYGQASNCVTSNCTITNCTTSNSRTCKTTPCSINDCFEPDCKTDCEQSCTTQRCAGRNCTQTVCVSACSYSPKCATSSCTVQNCTRGGYGGDCVTETVSGTKCPTDVRAPGIQYKCAGETFNWQKPQKSCGACDIGVEGFVFLGDANDATGQLDVSGSSTGLKQFGVSTHEPCVLTVANNNHLSGIRLSFCDDTGASLMRVSYPNQMVQVDMSHNYYDVQASDDVLIFHVASRTDQCEKATFQYGPTPKN